jgi:DNA-binding protein HU-beta
VNKTELINSISEKSGLNKKTSAAALDAFVKTVEHTLATGGKVVLIGFGTFEARKRNARKGRNPQTKAAITIPASTLPAFKAGKALRAAVNKTKKK